MSSEPQGPPPQNGRTGNKRKERADRIIGSASGSRLKGGQPDPSHIKRMAQAAGVQEIDVERQLCQLEAAARWLTADLRTNQTLADWIPSKVSERLSGIENSCARTLKGFGISNPAEALDGPKDEAVARALLFVADEDHLRHALNEIARVAAWASDARRHLVSPSAKPAEISTISEFVRGAVRNTTEGNSNEPPVDDWLRAIAKIYWELTGVEASASWDRVTESPRGFTAFAMAAGEPIGLKYTPTAWKARIARIKSF